MVRTTYDLKGRAAIVTGASSGIGVGIATELAAVGARVVAVGRNVARLEGLATTIRGAGGEIAVVEADISTQSGIEAIINGAVAAFGGIDSIDRNIVALGYHRSGCPNRAALRNQLRFKCAFRAHPPGDSDLIRPPVPI